MANVTVKITHNEFPRIAAALPEKTDEVVRKAAFDIEAQAKNRAAVDTGALKSSIYTNIGGQSTYGDARSAAAALNPGAEFVAEVAAEEHTAVIGPSVEYAPFVEFGTRSRTAKPFLIPAAEAVRPVFISAMQQMLRTLAHG